MPRRTFNNDGESRALRAPLPAATDTYSPIPNSYFLNTIPNQINAVPYLRVGGRTTYTNLHGTQLITLISVFDERRQGEQGEINMMFAGRNSYDKSRSAALAVGANVIICGNGVFSGDLISFRRKHTGAIAEELEVKVRHAIGGMVTGFDRILQEVDIMKNYNITQRQKAQILGVMYFEKNMVTPNQLSVIRDELRNSEHFKGNTVWDLYNNVTESLKRSHPFNHIENHVRLHKFMSEVAGINEEPEVTAEEIYNENQEPDVDYREIPDEQQG